MICKVLDTNHLKLSIFSANEEVRLLLWKNHPQYTQLSCRPKDSICICYSDIRKGGNFLTREEFKQLLKGKYIELIYESESIETH